MTEMSPVPRWVQGIALLPARKKGFIVFADEKGTG